MSRACFLSAGGDPFIAMLAIKLWQEIWKDEVDHFYVNYNNHAEVPVEVAAEFCQRVVQIPNLHLIYHPRGIGNGVPINEMVKISHEDLIMLLEDDGYIFESGAVNRAFQRIESDLTDVVGSERRSCGDEIWDRSQEKYNLDYSGYGDVGPNWWPNFFFCKREDILKTDMDFGSVAFKTGDYCKELDYTFKDINYGDTFVWMCIQLRALGVRSQNIPQHHAAPFEITDKESQIMNWHPSQQPFEWIHAGSLSSGWNGYLNRLLPDVSDDSAKQEIETRVSFWQLASDTIDGFDSFKEEYRKGIETLIVNGNLNRDRIQQKYNIYKNLMRV